MPQRITEEFVDDFLKEADALENGSAGDMKLLCRVVAKDCHISAAILKYGCFRADDCKKPAMTYPQMWAMIAGMVTLTGLLMVIADKLIK